MSLMDQLRGKKHQITEVAQRFGATNIRVFGSVAREDEGPDSDIDFLVDFEPGRSLLDQAGLIIELESLLRRKVEIGTTRGIQPPYRDRILREAKSL